jgi:hypothetical protein
MPHCLNSSKVPHKNGRSKLQQLDFGTIPTLCNIVFPVLYGTLEMFWECDIIGFSILLWTCSESVALFVFLWVFETVPTVWHYWFSIGLWNCSDSVILFVFLWDIGTVPTVWHYLFWKTNNAILSEQFQSPIEKPIMPHCRKSFKVQ